MTEIIKCVFMDKAYEIRQGDVITADDAYWMGDELIINSFYIGDNDGFKHTAFRIIEMKIEGTQNIRIDPLISGKIVGKMVIDNFRNITMFSLEVK